MGFENEWTKRIAELKDKIIALEFQARENENLIRILRNGNKGKDEMIASMIDDVVTEKKQVLRWEAFAHRTVAEADRMRQKLEALGGDPDN